MESITLKIDGMTCQGCVGSVTRVLTAVTGVAKVDVKLQPGQATIDFDPNKTSVDELRKSISGAGFDVAS